jgi:hypothetical protein
MQTKKDKPGIIILKILENGIPLKMAGEQKKTRKKKIKTKCMESLLSNNANTIFCAFLNS